MSARHEAAASVGTKTPELEPIRLAVFDVDGVLTDGRIVYGPRGTEEELMHFHVQDGIALKWLRRAGVRVAWITGRGCSATRARAGELEIDELAERVLDKGAALRELQARLAIGVDATLAMGDDLPDLAMRSRCAVFVAPANATDAVKERAELVTRASGGHGAVREIAEALLRAKGRWQELVDAALR